MEEKNRDFVKLKDNQLEKINGGVISANGKEIKCPVCGCTSFHGKSLSNFTTVYCDAHEHEFDISEYLA